MTTVSSVFNDCAAGIRAKVIGIYGLLVAGTFFIVSWLISFLIFRGKGYCGARRGKLSPVPQ